MDVKEMNGELNELREKLLTGQINRRQFISKLSKFGLSIPVAMFVLQSSQFFSACLQRKRPKRRSASKCSTRSKCGTTASSKPNRPGRSALPTRV